MYSFWPYIFFRDRCKFSCEKFLSPTCVGHWSQTAGGSFLSRPGLVSVYMFFPPCLFLRCGHVLLRHQTENIHFPLTGLDGQAPKFHIKSTYLSNSYPLHPNAKRKVDHWFRGISFLEWKRLQTLLHSILNWTNLFWLTSCYNEKYTANINHKMYLIALQPSQNALSKQSIRL